MILCISFYVFKVYLSNIDSETAEIYYPKKKKEKKTLLILGVGATLYYDLKYNR